MLTFEVRVPAYERPQLLFRALRSLEAQRYPHWKAVVYDDSRSEDVREVVAGFPPEKFTYVRNHQRLGAAFNIDQCFDPAPQTSGQYGCVLEDDNYWLPGFLELVSNAIRRHPWDLILANQRIHDCDKGLLPPNVTTRGDWFRGGSVEPLDLRAVLLFMEGLSNGGLVWKLGSGLDLRVGVSVKETGLHEACRSLLVSGPFFFIEEAQAVWSLMPKQSTARKDESNRIIARGMQSIRDFVLTEHGRGLVQRARTLAVDSARADQLVHALSYAGRPHWTRGVACPRTRSVCLPVIKGAAVRLIQGDPCAVFLRSSRIPSLAENEAAQLAGSATR